MSKKILQCCSLIFPPTNCFFMYISKLGGNLKCPREREREQDCVKTSCYHGEMSIYESTAEDT